MIADSKILCAANYQNRILVALKPEMLKTTNIREKDPILIIYEEDQIVIKKQMPDEDVAVDIVGYMENVKKYQQFYQDLEKDIVEFVGRGARKGSIKIDNLLNEARQKLPGVEIDKKIFLKELSIYLRGKGIKVIRSADLESLIFRAVDEVENKEIKDGQ